MEDTESELVNAIADYMPLGTALHLHSGDSGFFLGEVRFGKDNINSGYGVLTPQRELYVVSKQHIQSFAETEAALAPKTAGVLLKIVDLASEWKEIDITTTTTTTTTTTSDGSLYLPDGERGSSSNKKKKQEPMLRAIINQDQLSNSEVLLSALQIVSEMKLPKLVREVPGSIVRQKQIVQQLKSQLNDMDIVKENEGTQVLDALRYAAAQRDPVRFVNGGTKSSDNDQKEVYAWRMFQSVLGILQGAGAMKGTEATDLGRMVGSLSSDNELWLAMVLKQEGIKKLQPGQLGAVICGVTNDGWKASNAFMKYGASVPVIEMFTDLEILSLELKELQSTSKVDFPVHLSRELGGLVETWVGGVTWRELCRDTSLDQGDLCRMLRRTLEVLKQIPLADCVPDEVANIAREAADAMDRFPVADADPADQTSTTAGVGFGGAASGDIVDTNAVVDEDVDLSFLYDEENDNGNDNNSKQSIVKDIGEAGLELDPIQVLDEIFGAAASVETGFEILPNSNEEKKEE